MGNTSKIYVYIGEILVSAIIISLGISGFMLMGKRRSIARNAVIEHLPPLVQTVPVQVQQGFLDVYVNGVVEPYREISLAAEVAGRVTFKSPKCKNGLFVISGETLFQIDSRDYQLRCDQLEKQIQQNSVELDENEVETLDLRNRTELARETLELQKKDLERAQLLVKNRIISDSELESQNRQVLERKALLIQLENQLNSSELHRKRILRNRENTEILLEQARLDLGRTEIKAPLSGVITSERVEVNSYVNPGSILVQMEDTSLVEVRCNLKADEMYWIWSQKTEGNPCADKENMHSGYCFPATPATIINTVAGVEHHWQGVFSRYDGIGRNRTTRTIPCRVIVENPRDVTSVISERTVWKDGTLLSSPSSSVEVPLYGPGALVRGMFVSVCIHTSPKEQLYCVPEVALQPGNRIYVVRDEKLEIIPVYIASVGALSAEMKKNLPKEIAQLLKERSAWATVRSAHGEIRPGDHVILSPLGPVYSGMKVRENASVLKDTLAYVRRRGRG